MFASAILAATLLTSRLQVDVPPVVKGLHLMIYSHDAVADLTKFIGKELADEGVNTLILEVDYNYHFQTHPEVGDANGLTKEDARQLAAACKAAKITLIPQVNLLGHQSWAESTGHLLTSHPEFDETPGKFPKNKDIYCRSYCPLAPGLHKVVFDLLDELGDAFQAPAIHCGMDEVMILADPDCPRCKGKPTAELFALEVNALHRHLASVGRTMWMWGDRFIDGKVSGLGDWEASGNNTADAINHVPKDIVICDWHYEKAEVSPAYFAVHGFPVLACPWRDTTVALGQVSLFKGAKNWSSEAMASRFRGILCTTWSEAKSFIDAYHGKGNKEALEAANCFKETMKLLR